MPTTDPELLAEARATGDKRSLDTLLTRHYPAVYRVIHNLVHNEADASDLAQATFVRALEGAPFRGEGRFRSWIMAIAVREVRQHWRRRRRAASDPLFEAFELSRRTDPTAEDAADAASRREFEQALEVALETFPKRLKVPLVLHYFEGMSFAEIAAALELAKSTVQSRCERALGRLRDVFVRRGHAALVPLIGRYFGGVRIAPATAGLPLAVAAVLLLTCGAAVWFGVAPLMTVTEPPAVVAAGTPADTPPEPALAPEPAPDARTSRPAAAPAAEEAPRRQVHTTGDGVIAGRLVLAGGLRPVAGAEVSVSLSYDHRNGYPGADDARWFVNTYVTAEDGRFACDMLDPRRVYDLYLRHPAVGYRAVGSVVFPPGVLRVDVGVVLTDPGHALRGTVVDESGRPLPGAAVTVGDFTGTPRLLDAHLPAAPMRGALGRTDAEGRFTCAGLSAGIHRVLVRLDGYGPRAVPAVRIGPGGAHAPLRVVMTAPASLAGHVVDGAARPVAGASVEAMLSENQVLSDGGYAISRYLQRATTGADGSFAFDGLPRVPGATYFLNCAAAGFEDGYAGGHVAGERGIRVVLERTHATGTGPHEVVGLLAAPGRAWPMGVTAQVELQEATGAQRRLRAAVDGAGWFQVRGVTAGDHRLTIRAPGFLALHRTLQVGGAATCDAGTLELDPGCTLEGRVTDALTGRPIRGAAVRGRGDLVVRTDAAGGFALGGFERRDNVLLGVLGVSAPGYRPVEPGVRLSATRDRVRHDVQLTPVAALPPLTGTVRDPGGRPVAGALVRASIVVRSTSTVRVTRSDLEGRFAFPAIDAENVNEHTSLRVDHPAWATQMVPLQTVAGPHDVVLHDGRTVSGRVLDTTGVPVAGARIGVTLAAPGQTDLPGLDANDIVGRGVTDGEGRFVLDRIPAGRCCVQAFHPDCRVPPGGPAAPHFVPAGGAATVHLTLARGRPLQGSVLDVDGRPVAGVRVFGYGIRSGAVVSAADGAFTFPAVFQDRVDLHLQEPHVIGVLAGATPGARATVTAHRCGGLTGTLLDAAGAPAPGRTVQCRAHGLQWQASSDPSGAFSFDRVAAGEVDVLAGGVVLGRFHVAPDNRTDAGTVRLRR